MNRQVFSKKIDVASLKLPFILESGFTFESAPVVYETYGNLNENRDNVILVLHGLNADSHGASHNEGDVSGWWEPMVGPGKVLDTERYFVLIPNGLGSCFGTLGPLTINPVTGQKYGADFPQITVRDMIHLTRRLLSALGISAPSAVVGGSLGGMQALEWAVSFPEDGADVIGIVAPERTSAQSIGFNHIMKQAVENDPNWQGGYYDENQPPEKGLALARSVGMMTYQTGESAEQKFGRRRREGQWEIGNYLDYQGKKVVARFDANSYLRLLDAMDSHDLTRGRAEYPKELAGKKGRIFLIGDDSDLLYGISNQKELAEKWVDAGADARWYDLDTFHGHDSFLVDFPKLSAVIRDFMEEKGSR
jgi:homoserine O-acetyltransferase